MKLLLDENLPHPLRPLITGHDVFTVAYMGWSGVLNGKLLALAAANGFHALITKDSGIEYEQNVERLPCAVVTLQAKSNDIVDILPLIPALLAALDQIGTQKVIRVTKR